LKVGCGGHESYVINDEKIYRNGAVGAIFEGNIIIDQIYSLGCRPIGPPLKITSCSGKIVTHVNERRVADVFQEIIDKLLTETDSNHISGYPQLGIEITDKDKSNSFKEKAFMIRNFHITNKQEGSISCTETFENGQYIRLFVPDRRYSLIDFQSKLHKYIDTFGSQIVGALAFSSTERLLNDNQKFLGEKGDGEIINYTFKNRGINIATAGVYCNGEFMRINDSTCQQNSAGVYLTLFREIKA